MKYRLKGKRRLFVIICPLLFTICSGASVHAQVAEQSWEKAAGGKQHFEIASVREDKSTRDSNSNFTLDGNGNTYWVMNQDVKTAPEGSLFRATNQPLLRYIIFAYRLSGTQELALRGAGLGFSWAGLGIKVPAWVADTHYDIEARASAAATKDQMRLMMQTLLAERFKLTVHKETRQAPVFAIALDRPRTLGPQLRPHPPADTCATTVYPDAPQPHGDAQSNPAKTASVQTLPIPCGMIARLPPSVPGRHKIGGRNITLAMLAESLPAQTGLATFPKPVIDLTRLTGTFDLSLEWTQAISTDNMPVGPEAQGEDPGSPIAQAIKQQLGLKLESTEGPVELLVIDHVEQPTAN